MLFVLSVKTAVVVVIVVAVVVGVVVAIVVRAIGVGSSGENPVSGDREGESGELSEAQS